MGRTNKSNDEPGEIPPGKHPPKRSRKKAEPPAGELTPEQIASGIQGVTTGDHLLTPLSPALPELEALHPTPFARHDTPENPNGPIHERNGKPNEAEALRPPFEPTPSHVERIRPTGPRKRTPDDLFSIYVSKDITVSKDADLNFMVESRKELTDRQMARLNAMGFEDVSERQDGSSWLANTLSLRKFEPATAALLMEEINNLGPELDGKYQRLAQGSPESRRR
jgi:hypothetical protein